jgi:two-component system, OmpR family, phosphate regulon sensor histidine kinase PhoR
MTKNTRLLLTVCLLAITGVIGLQFYWVRNYYYVSLADFEREVNLAFEDAVKKEFQLRCDTVEQLMVEQLLDTSAFIINSKYFNSSKRFGYNIINTKNKRDFTSFSHNELQDSLKTDDTIYRRKIAIQYARSLRTEDLENHVVYYRTQNIGQFLNDKIRQYGFDTNRLRPVFQQYLDKRNIYTPFYFHASKADSSLNYVELPDSLGKTGLVITKSFSTYKWWTYDERYIRAVFENPVGYVFSQMKWILGGSLLLVVLVALCIGLLAKALFREKRLAVIKNDFINNITHELKTPIATVSAAVESLQEIDFNQEKDKASRYLGHARNELKRLTKLVDNILNISLYEKNKLTLHPEPISLDNGIQAIMEGLILTADKPISYAYANKSGTGTIVADKLLFHQALVNVLDNAIKYSHPKVQINILCYNRDNYCCVQCTDYGEGIAASSLAFVFEKFYREPKPGHAVKGHGLGLNYVQEIMKAHYGKIELSSSKGKGTTVILSWPL